MSSGSRAVLVPGVLALLPEYAGIADPVADLRTACAEAVGWLAEAGPVTVLGTDQGRRVGESLLASGGFETVAAQPPQPPTPVVEEGALAPVSKPPLLVVGNGSAKRTEKAPGHVDDRAVAFDAALGGALASGRLAGLDLGLSEELWADTAAIAALADLLPPGLPASVDYDADPFGVQYWVARWEW